MKKFIKFNFQVSLTHTTNFLYQIINVGAHGIILYFLMCIICSLEYHKFYSKC